MSRLEIILLAVSITSIFFNVIMVLYSRRLIVELLSISEELGDIQQMTRSFTNHIQAVYNLETFYGDETLQGLLDHAKSYDEYLETFEYVYSLTTTEENDLVSYYFREIQP
jgi:hypothetical protein